MNERRRRVRSVSSILWGIIGWFVTSSFLSPDTHKPPSPHLKWTRVCIYFVQVLSLESNKWRESCHRGAWPRWVGVGVDMCVSRLPCGCVHSACWVLGDHRLVVGFAVCSGTLLVAKRSTHPFKTFGLSLPGVVVCGVAHVVVDEGVLWLLVLVVTVC